LGFSEEVMKALAGVGDVEIAGEEAKVVENSHSREFSDAVFFGGSVSNACKCE